MSAVVEWLSNNLGTIATIATVVIACSAAVTARLTRNLVEENRLLKKAGAEPKVVAYLSLDDYSVHFINFSLANVGKGPARNISYDMDIEARFIGANRVGWTNERERQPIGFLPQDEKISMFFGSGIGLLGEEKLPPTKVKVEWENLEGKKFKDEYELDVRQFLGFSSIATSPEEEIAKSVKKIATGVDRLLASNRLGSR